MNSLTKFYIVRHGETDWNKKGISQGQTDIKLNEQGEIQALNVADELKNIKFDYVFSSDLIRAKRTADIIAKEHELIAQTAKALRERSFGSLEGKPVEAFVNYIKSIEAIEENKRIHARYDNFMESEDSFTSRVITFIRETSIVYPGKTILLVTHSGVLRVMLKHLGIVKLKEIKNRRSIELTGYIVLESDGVDFYLKHSKGIHIT